MIQLLTLFLYLLRQNKWLPCIHVSPPVHVRRLFSCSGRHMEPPPLWPMQWSMALSVYSQLCAVCDGWRWREKPPGWAADIKISSRDAVEEGVGGGGGLWPCHPQISPLLTHSSPSPLHPSSSQYVSVIPITILLTCTSSYFLSLFGCTRLSWSIDFNAYVSKVCQRYPLASDKDVQRFDVSAM